MCTVCGCGETTQRDRVDGRPEADRCATDHDHDSHRDCHHDHESEHRHGHHREHAGRTGPTLDFGANRAGVSIGGLPTERLIDIETDILTKNDRFATVNRARLAESAVFSINLVSSPGSGKTTLLCRTIEALGAAGIAVIEGDQQTANDAERIRASGARAVQINTGKGCHLDARMVSHAIDRLELSPGTTLFIENVGNLVCPAAFDLGEDVRVAILAVTEGDDKPLKYPDIFAGARLAILNKLDLAPHCDVDLDRFEANLRRVNPDIAVLRLSARTGEGMAGWLDWCEAGLAAKASRSANPTIAPTCPAGVEGS